MPRVVEGSAEPCAWHSSPEELAQAESPGICEQCSGEVLIESTRRQVNKKLSYVDRIGFIKRIEDKYAKEV